MLFVTSDLDSDGVPDNLDVCADTRIPESVPTVALRLNHYALVDGDGVFDTVTGRNPPETFTIDETGGCSCEQILDRTGAAAGQRFFGCSVDTLTRWIAARP